MPKGSNPREHTRASLEPTGAEMSALVEYAMRHILVYVQSLTDQGTGEMGAGGDRVVELLEEALPERGMSPDVLFELLFRDVIPTGINTASPGHLSYIPNGGVFHTAVAELIAASTNRYVAYWAAGPGLAQLELTVLRWLCDLVGYTRASSGVLTSGGSIANLMALVTARRSLLPADFSRGAIYASDQMHHSIRKAALIAGFPPEQVRIVPSDGEFRMDIESLRAQVSRDRAKGSAPFFVVATAGTTNTGAVDDIAGLADFCAEQKMWLHVDAAYGGFFLLTERGRSVMHGIERADSVVLDPHKSLFLPFGTGSLLVKDGERLEHAHRVHSEYISAAVEAGEVARATNFADLSLEMSRAPRGLRLWLPLKLLGASAFRDALDEKLDLAAWCEEQLRERSFVRLMSPTHLSTVAFRVVVEGASEDELDELNQQVLAGINRRGRVHLSHTILHGREVIRVCVLSFRTHRVHLEAFLEDLDATVAELT